jgi:hypothetical protein
VNVARHCAVRRTIIIAAGLFVAVILLAPSPATESAAIADDHVAVLGAGSEITAWSKSGLLEKAVANPPVAAVADQAAEEAGTAVEADAAKADRTAKRPVVQRVSAAQAVASGSVWDRLAQCESGGNWQANTGNGYYGGLQFLPSTWHSVGGTGLPHEHSREEQIHRAQILQARAGWGQWPACSTRLGLRG